MFLACRTRSKYCPCCEVAPMGMKSVFFLSHFKLRRLRQDKAIGQMLRSYALLSTQSEHNAEIRLECQSLLRSLVVNLEVY